MGTDVRGIDLDPQSVRVAESRCGVGSCALGTLEAYVATRDDRAPRFDLVTFFEVLEHQVDPVGFLAQVAQLAAPDASSGGTVYDQAASQPAGEEQRLGPTSYYGAGKAAAEMFLHALCRQHHRQVVIIRPTNVYGEGQAPSPGFGIVPTAFACCLNDQPFTLFGDGSNLRDYLYVDDLCRLLLDVVDHETPTPGLRTINAAAGDGKTINEVLALVESVS